MNRLNLNKLSFKITTPSKFWPINIISILGFVFFIFSHPALAEQSKDSDKPPATGPVSTGMKKLSFPQGIITDFPIVPSNIIKQAGYLLPLPESEGSIIDTHSKLVRFGLGELVYIDTGSKRNISPGDRLAVVRYDQFIYHPVLGSTSGVVDSRKGSQEYSWGISGGGRPLGYLVRILGELKVLEVDKTISKAVVSESYEDMMVGDRIIPALTPSVLLENREPEDKVIEGYIVASKIASSLLAMTDIVYLDVGRSQNAAMGDRFEVYMFPDIPSGEELLPIVVGELVVINAQNDTSTAVILNGSEDLKIGRKIRYKK